MNIQKRRIKTFLLPTALTLISAAVPVLAAPTDATLPTASVVKLTTAAPLLKPTAVKTLAPIVPPVATKSEGRASAKHHSDYRYSNPTRWHSDMTANSIRNQ